MFSNEADYSAYRLEYAVGSCILRPEICLTMDLDDKTSPYSASSVAGRQCCVLRLLSLSDFAI